MGRSPCCDENGLKKGPWTPEEDQKLVEHIQKHGHGSWRALPKLAGLNRCGKSCRLRWTNYLRPDIKRGKFSQEEEQTILHLHSILGNKWSAIATHLPGRTDNEIKNFWNTHLKKKLIQMGFDPMTHQPRTDLVSTLPYLLALANMTDLMDHHHHHQYSLDEHALRLQLEAAHLSKLQYLQYLLQSSSSSSNSLTTNNNNNANNSFDQNATITDNSLMEPSFILLNSSVSDNNVKESPVMECPQQLLDNINSASLLLSSPSHEIASSSHCQPLHHHQNVMLSHHHFLDPQEAPFSSSQSCLNNSTSGLMQGQGNNFASISQQAAGGDHTVNIDGSSSWNNNNIVSPSDPAPNMGDASSSTSSHGGGGGGGGYSSSSYWPELYFFADPIMPELS